MNSVKIILYVLICFHISVVFALDEDRPPAPAMATAAAPETVAMATAAAPETVVTVPSKSNFDRFIENFWFSDNPRAGGMISLLKEKSRLTVKELIQFAHTHGTVEMLEAFLDLEGERLLDYQKEELQLLIDAKKDEQNIRTSLELKQVPCVQKPHLGNFLRGNFRLKTHLIECLLYKIFSHSVAQYNYANFIAFDTGKISKGWYGEEITEENRYEKAAALYRQANTPDAKGNYGLLVQDGKISKDWYGEEITEENRYEKVAALYFASNTPETKNNYALLVQNGKIFVDWASNPVRDPIATAACMYRDLYRGISDSFAAVAMNNFLGCVLSGFRETMDKFSLLSDKAAYEYILNQCASSSQNLQLPYKDTLSAFAKAKLLALKPRPTFDDYVQTVNSAEDASALGQKGAEELLEALEPEIDPSLRLDTPEEEVAQAAAVASSPTKLNLKDLEDEEGGRRQNIEAERLLFYEKRTKYQAFLTQNKQLRQDRIKAAGKHIQAKMAQDKNPLEDYKIDVRVDVPGALQSRFDILINAIKKGTRDGAPEALRGDVRKMKSLFQRLYGIDIKHLYSRRMTEKHRLIYAFDHTRKTIHIFQVEEHYDD